LNAWLLAFRDELLANELAVKRVEISLVTYGLVRKITKLRAICERSNKMSLNVLTKLSQVSFDVFGTGRNLVSPD